MNPSSNLVTIEALYTAVGSSSFENLDVLCTYTSVVSSAEYFEASTDCLFFLSSPFLASKYFSPSSFFLSCSERSPNPTEQKEGA